LEASSLPFKQTISPSIKKYREFYENSIRDPETFWGEQARKLEWFKAWDKVLDWEPPFARWFVGGLLNASYLCVDKHVKTWRRSKVAIYWEDEFGNARTSNYSQLYSAVTRRRLKNRKMLSAQRSSSTCLDNPSASLVLQILLGKILLTCLFLLPERLCLYRSFGTRDK
jgi:hypothetical protein